MTKTIKEIEFSPIIITEIIITTKTEIKIKTIKVIKTRDEITITIIIEIINNKTTTKKIIKNPMKIEIIKTEIIINKIKITKNPSRTHGKKTTIMKMNKLNKQITLG